MSIAIEQKELKEKGTISFNNPHNMDAEWFDVTLDYGKNSTWDSPFKLWINGELVGTYETFSGIKKRAEKVIEANDLRKAN